MTTQKPSALAPGIEPLATAADLPGFEVVGWIGVMMPSGTPKALVDRVSGAVDKSMRSPDTGEKIAAAGLEVDYRNAAAMSDYLKVLRERYADIIKKNNIRIE